MNQERYDDVTELTDLKMEHFCAENKDVKKGVYWERFNYTIMIESGLILMEQDTGGN